MDATVSVLRLRSRAAAAAVRVHLREILLVLPRLAKAFPDLFEDEELPGHAADLQPVLRVGA